MFSAVRLYTATRARVCLCGCMCVRARALARERRFVGQRRNQDFNTAATLPPEPLRPLTPRICLRV